MPKAKKTVETKDSGEKILSLIPARADLLVNYTKTNEPAEEGAEPTVSKTARHAVALALCEDTEGNQYVRALTIEDLTANDIDAGEFDSVSI